eukprot:COSAG02_NODE_2695_length_8214_cov_12.071842_6_plen_696_part_00
MEQLLAMGFPALKCEVAMAAAGNVDGAISYILANEDQQESFWQVKVRAVLCCHYTHHSVEAMALSLRAQTRRFLSSSAQQRPSLTLWIVAAALSSAQPATISRPSGAAQLGQAAATVASADGVLSRPPQPMQPAQPATLPRLVQPRRAAATAASADSVLAKLQEALNSSREESTSFSRRVLDWLRSPAPEPPTKLLGDLEEAPPLSDRRKHMFTASRFADMAGVSPYGLPHSLWLVMTGREPADEVFQGNEATRRGQELEPVARRAYELRFAKSAPPCDFAAHPEHIWLGATPDGVIGEDGLLEIKCPMHRAHEEVPRHYMAQVQGQLEIMDRAWCDFVCWQPDRMVVIHIPRSREYWAWLYPLLERFYAHVLSDEPLPEEAKTPPPPPAVVNVVTLYDGPPPLVTAKLPVKSTPAAPASDEVAAATQDSAAKAGACGRGRGRGRGRGSGSARGAARGVSGTRAAPGPARATAAAAGLAAATADTIAVTAAASAPAAATGAAAAAAAALAAAPESARAATGTGMATTTAQRAGLKRTAEEVGEHSSPPAKKMAAATVPNAGIGQRTPTSAAARVEPKTGSQPTGTSAKGPGTENGAAAGSASHSGNLSKTKSAGARGDAGQASVGGGGGGGANKSGTSDKKKQGKDGGGRGAKGGSGGRGRGRARGGGGDAKNRGGRGGKGKGRGKGGAGGGGKG